MMLKPAFIDISHHNVRSFEEARATIYGVIHKLTEGTGFVDGNVMDRYPAVRAAGLLWGLYHFVRPGDIEAQVDHFLNSAIECEVIDDDTLLCLDWEDSAVTADDAVEFLRLVEQRTGHAPVLYSGHVLKEALGGHADPRLSEFRLWLAQYTEGEPDIPPGWSDFWAWQYSDSGEVPGMVPPTDVNAYRGTVAQLRAEWSGRKLAPRPEPEPELAITLIVPPGVRVDVVERAPDDDV
jgi:lysozyme